MGLNRASIMGRFTRDPELRRTPNGIAVTAFTLAVEDDFKGADGTRKTHFIDVVAWRGTAEFVCGYFGKGRMAVADGKLQQREWTDRDGNKRKAVEIVADSVYFADSRPSEGSNSISESVATYSAPSFAEVEDDDDIPF